MKISFYEWITEKKKRGEELRLTALLVDVDNSPLLKANAKKMIEDDFALELPDDFDLTDPQTRLRVDRMFIYEVNRYALEHLLEADRQALTRAANMKAIAMEFVKLPNVTEEQKEEAINEVEAFRQEVLKNHEATLNIKTLFEKQEHIDGFIADGSVWFRDDKQLALDIIEEIEEVKDDEVNNLITASSLVSKIDELLLSINSTIERLDMFIAGEDIELEEEIEGAVEVSEDEPVAATVEEAQKEKIEPTHLPDAKKELEREQEENEEIVTGAEIDPNLLNGLVEEQPEETTPAQTPPAP